MLTNDEHRQHIRNQKIVTAAVVLSVSMTYMFPELRQFCLGAEICTCLTWIWIE